MMIEKKVDRSKKGKVLPSKNFKKKSGINKENLSPKNPDAGKPNTALGSRVKNEPLAPSKTKAAPAAKKSKSPSVQLTKKKAN